MEYDRIVDYQKIELMAFCLKKIFHKNIMGIWIYWAARKEDKREGILMIIKKQPGMIYKKYLICNIWRIRVKQNYLMIRISLH